MTIDDFKPYGFIKCEDLNPVVILVNSEKKKAIFYCENKNLYTIVKYFNVKKIGDIYRNIHWGLDRGIKYEILYSGIDCENILNQYKIGNAKRIINEFTKR